MTASSSCCTPLFLNDEPQKIGTNSPVTVPLRMQALSTAGIELAVLDELHERVFVERERVLEQLLAQLRNPLDPVVVAARIANLKRPCSWSSGTVSQVLSLSSDCQM